MVTWGRRVGSIAVALASAGPLVACGSSDSPPRRDASAPTAPPTATETSPRPASRPTDPLTTTTGADGDTARTAASQPATTRRAAVKSLPRGIAFVRYTVDLAHPRVYVVNSRGGEARPLRLGVQAAEGPAWSPDGRRLAFIGGKNLPNQRNVVGGDLYVARGEGSVRRVTRDDAQETGATWSSDGRRIAYVRSPPRSSNRSSIMVVNAGGGRPRRLTHGAIDLQPSWGPAGTGIAFLRINPRTRQGAIWVMRPDGSGLRRILRGLAGAAQPVWSPDGRRLLVAQGDALVVIRPDGSGRRVIAKLTSDARGAREDPQPAWSPDGGSVVFCQFRARTAGRSDLWVARADGSSRRRLSTSPEFDTDPAWGA